MSKERDANANADPDCNFCPEASVSVPVSRNGLLRKASSLNALPSTPTLSSIKGRLNATGPLRQKLPTTWLPANMGEPKAVKKRNEDNIVFMLLHIINTTKLRNFK